MVPLVSTVQEIEAAIERLSPKEFLALCDRLRAKHHDAWDRQIAEDSASLVRELDENITKDRTRPIC